MRITEEEKKADEKKGADQSAEEPTHPKGEAKKTAAPIRNGLASRKAMLDF